MFITSYICVFHSLKLLFVYQIRPTTTVPRQNVCKRPRFIKTDKTVSKQNVQYPEHQSLFVCWALFVSFENFLLIRKPPFGEGLQILKYVRHLWDRVPKRATSTVTRDICLQEHTYDHYRGPVALTPFV